jgi:hypothetical protein
MHVEDCVAFSHMRRIEPGKPSRSFFNIIERFAFERAAGVVICRMNFMTTMKMDEKVVLLSACWIPSGNV